MDKEFMIKAFKEYTKNPFFKELYNNAPKNVKKLYLLDFYNCTLYFEEKYTDETDKEYIKLSNKLFSIFTDEDWEYLIKNTPSNRGVSRYKELRRKYSKGQE